MSCVPPPGSRKLQIPGVLLAGGLSRRMGGGDKGLLELAGKPLMTYAIERLRLQASPLAINANGDASRFVQFGLPVIPDLTAGYAGPLAGVLTAMRWAEEAAPHARFVATVACDTPFFPVNLIKRLLDATKGTYPAIAVAASLGRIHPVFALLPVTLAGDLDAALSSGMRRVSDWIVGNRHFAVDFTSETGKSADPFFNVNTPEQLAEAESWLILKQ
jgi:molybdenum cofactor guanylyltransferase